MVAPPRPPFSANWGKLTVTGQFTAGASGRVIPVNGSVTYHNQPNVTLTRVDLSYNGFGVNVKLSTVLNITATFVEIFVESVTADNTQCRFLLLKVPDSFTCAPWTNSSNLYVRECDVSPRDSDPLHFTFTDQQASTGTDLALKTDQTGGSATSKLELTVTQADNKVPPASTWAVPSGCRQKRFVLGPLF